MYWWLIPLQIAFGVIIYIIWLPLYQYVLNLGVSPTSIWVITIILGLAFLTVMGAIIYPLIKKKHKHQVIPIELLVGLLILPLALSLTYMIHKQFQPVPPTPNPFQESKLPNYGLNTYPDIELDNRFNKEGKEDNKKDGKQKDEKKQNKDPKNPNDKPSQEEEGKNNPANEEEPNDPKDQLRPPLPDILEDQPNPPPRPQPENTSDQQANLDPYLSLDPELKQEKNIIMYVDVSDPTFYLRQSVLSGFDADKHYYTDLLNRWEEDIPNLSSLSRWEIPDNVKYKSPTQNRKELVQRYYIKDKGVSGLIGVDQPQLIEPLVNRNRKIFNRIYRTTSLALPVYNLENKNQVIPWESLIQKDKTLQNVDEKFLKYYTKTKDEKRYKDLALKITQEEITLWGKIKALLKYFHKEFKYSLKPGKPENDDPLSHFLFKNKKGYCTYFAFALTRLSRELEIPSRVAVGFVVVPKRINRQRYVILADQAHAWTEIYFPQLGWITVDATPAGALGENLLPTAPNSLVQEMERDYQIDEDMNLLDKTTEEVLKATSDEQIMMEGALVDTRWRFFLPMLLLLPLLIFIIYKWYHSTQYLRYSRSQAKVVSYYTSFIKQLADLGYQRGERETHKEYCERINKNLSINLTKMTDWYEQVKYRTEFSQEPKKSEIYAEITQIEKQLSQYVPWWRRLIAVFRWNYLR